MAGVGGAKGKGLQGTSGYEFPATRRKRTTQPPQRSYHQALRTRSGKASEMCSQYCREITAGRSHWHGLEYLCCLSVDLLLFREFVDRHGEGQLIQYYCVHNEIKRLLYHSRISSMKITDVLVIREAEVLMITETKKHEYSGRLLGFTNVDCRA
jgi:hypothetical protein